MCFHSDLPPSSAGIQWASNEGTDAEPFRVTYDLHPHTDGASYVFAARADLEPDRVFVFRLPTADEQTARLQAEAFGDALKARQLGLWRILAGAEAVYTREGVTTYDGRRFDAAAGGVFAA